MTDLKMTSLGSVSGGRISKETQEDAINNSIELQKKYFKPKPKPKPVGYNGYNGAAVGELIAMAVTLRDFVTSEFGDNEYHDNELIRVLKSLGHDFHLSEDKELMILGSEEK